MTAPQVKTMIKFVVWFLHYPIINRKYVLKIVNSACFSTISCNNADKLTTIVVTKQIIMRSIILIAAIALFFMNPLPGQTRNGFPQAITTATQQGDASELANYFNSKIELILPSKSGVFSKEQAQYLMKDFFENNHPTSFQVIHQGVRDNSSFAIGKYSCSKGQYRLQFLTKNIDNQTLIIQIRIDKQDE